MQQRCGAKVLFSLLGWLLCCLILFVPTTWAQQTQGTVSVVVLDPTGGVISGAELKLVEQATNDGRNAVTQDAGNYTFVNLSFGSYRLTVTKTGFETQEYNVTVQTNRNTDVRATLKVGSTTQVVEVQGGVSPLVETTSSATNMTIDTKQIEDLPILGRNIAQLSRLSAGYNGTWNGLPTMAQGSTFDGIVGNTQRWKYSAGADSTAITPRLETIGEMTVSTDQLDLNQGWGTSNMQISYVTRRGTNAFHGRLFEDHRNSALNAHNWRSDSKPKFILNEFGGSIGGPIVRDKLFFFGSFSMSKQPGSWQPENRFFTSQAQQGIFTTSTGSTVNLFNAAAAYNTANGTNLPTAPVAAASARLAEINGYVGQGFVDSVAQSDPNISRVYWNQNNPITYYYPTFRIDYNPSQNLRVNFAYNQTKSNSPGANAGWFPEDGRASDNRGNALTGSLGVEWIISPTLINQFKAGYLYTANWFGQGATDAYLTGNSVEWSYSNLGDYAMSGMVYNLPNARMQPIISFADNLTWVKGKHTFGFGFNFFREQNKYWDPPEGYPIINLNLAEGDPALQALTNDSLGLDPNSDDLARAQQLYALLAGRVNSIRGRHAYNEDAGEYRTDVGAARLNELMTSWGWSFQDSFKVKPNLTLNYGLRWDFLSPNKDLTNKYHTLSPADLYGPSGEGNLFQPGNLSGTMNPVFTTQEKAYDSWKVTPQPAIGIAWTPRASGSLIERLLGGDKTVVRAGYSLRRFTEPQQFVWDMGSAYGMAFYQPFSATANNSGEVGTFVPGSVTWGGTYPSYVYTPSEYAEVIPMADITFNSDQAATAIDPKIRQPYTQSWNFGIQRELGPSRAFEIRYNGSRTLRQWISENINEVNIFENGFLEEFKHAQANLALNGGTSFAPGSAGSYNLPIMTAAGIDFTNAGFINNLRLGQVGTFAGTLATNRDYFCNMVGTAFSPCGASYGAGAGIPVNFFVANPFAVSSWTGAAQMTDRGFSNYHALQAEFRQRAWRGLSFAANYTWSRTLGVATALDWTGAYSQVTIRNLRSAYGPLGTDRNQVVHLNATYDLPFGKGKMFLNQSGILNKVLGGWTASTIVTFQTGAPFRLYGANETINDLTDGGVVLNGITAQDIQDHVGVFYNDANQVRYLDPEWISQMLANGSISSNTTPGEMGQIIYLHGPSQTYTDIALSKSVSITERVKFKFQTQFLNAFNHPVFAYSGRSISSTSGFGSAALQSGTRPRNIEFRANLEF